jgi:Helix-turn-helix domain
MKSIVAWTQLQVAGGIFMAQDQEVTRLIDVNQLAETWKVSPHTIRGWVASRRLNPTRICRRLLFTPNECERFLQTKIIAR